jgi:rRNA processing protein Gar1
MRGRFIPTYDTGGYSSEHGMAILQRGETVTSKTSNMLGGGGTVIHIHGDVYDEEKFVEKVAEVMGPVVRQTAMLNVRSM